MSDLFAAWIDSMRLTFADLTPQQLVGELAVTLDYLATVMDEAEDDSQRALGAAYAGACISIISEFLEIKIGRTYSDESIVSLREVLTGQMREAGQ